MSQTDVIIVGASARAAAMSAIRAGLTPWCADLFADRDLQAIATVHACTHRSYPMGLVELVKQARLPASTPVLLTGAMENHDAAVSALQTMHPILGPNINNMKWLRSLMRHAGNAADTLLPQITGLHWPVTLRANQQHQRTFKHNARAGTQWILKPEDSAGGVAVRKRRLWSRVRQNELRQQFIQGTPVGAVFRSTHDAVSNTTSCHLLGASQQIIGDKKFGSKNYRYVGSIGPISLTLRQNNALHELGKWLVNQSPFVGLFGVDLICDKQGGLWPIEINPRYTASVEVLEKSLSFTALDPTSQPAAATATTQSRGNRVTGKAYVFAKHNATAPDLYDFFDPHSIADMPAIHSPILKGHPICTLFAAGSDYNDCLKQLQEQAVCLYTRLL